MAGRKPPVESGNRELLAFLRLLEQKLEAPILNGGFDRLFENVENIKTEVDKLNKAVFDPENGLFVRVKSEKVETDHELKALEQKVSNLENQLKTYRKFVIGAAGSLALAGLGGLGKVVWGLVASHISFH
jgi:polyhydroxyalkanoate synthesis regulator phasin